MPEFDASKGFMPLMLENEDDLACEINNLLKNACLSGIGKKGGEKKSQFIAFRRRDCDLINELCCKHYNGHVTRNEKRRRVFEIGDKLCATKNKEVVNLISNSSVRITNGEILFLRDDIQTVNERGQKEERFWVLDDLERHIKVDYRTVKGLRLKNAYARTIHTYQVTRFILILLPGFPCLLSVEIQMN